MTGPWSDHDLKVRDDAIFIVIRPRFRSYAHPYR